MSVKKFKRFYETARAAAHESPSGGAGYRILLDGRPVKTPAKAEMVLPGQALADAIAAEWNAQGEDVDPRAMVLTGLVWTAIDLVEAKRDQVIEEIAAYGAHDLLCYRAESPDELIERQAALWQPLLDWAALTFDARLDVTSGIAPIAQPPAALAALRQAVAARDDLALTALGAAVSAAGSLIIGLALDTERIDATGAFDAAQIDESYQIERWGDDREALRRRDAIRSDLDSAARLMGLTRSP